MAFLWLEMSMHLFMTRPLMLGLFSFGMLLFTISGYGYEHQVIQTPEQRTHVVTLSPSEYEISLKTIDKKGYGQSVRAFAQGFDVAINAGFFRFDENKFMYPAGVILSPTWKQGSPIPRGVLGWNETMSVMDRLMVDDQLIHFEPTSLKQVAWSQLEWLIGGVPLLIQDGKAIHDYSMENIQNQSFIKDRHARVAVGFKANQDWVIVVSERTYELPDVDLPNQDSLADLFVEYIQAGNMKVRDLVRQHTIPVKEGMTLKELTDFMLNLGCVNALNLDGGGSSALYLHGVAKTKVVEDDLVPLTYQRPVHNAIVFKRKTNQ